MCFSASASFTTAAATGMAGLLCIASVRDRKDLLLAAMPLAFGAQQALEGVLWMLLPHGQTPVTIGLTYAFLAFAQLFWPLYVPLAARTCEPSKGRRRIMDIALVLGVVLAARFAWTLATRPHVAQLSLGHIAYDQADASWAALLLGATYVLAVCGPLLASSLRAVVSLGLIVLAGSVAAYVGYFAAFQSVWCYFAAAASLVIVGHFYRLRHEANRLRSVASRAA